MIVVKRSPPSLMIIGRSQKIVNVSMPTRVWAAAPSFFCPFRTIFLVQKGQKNEGEKMESMRWIKLLISHPPVMTRLFKMIAAPNNDVFLSDILLIYSRSLICYSESAGN